MGAHVSSCIPSAFYTTPKMVVFVLLLLYWVPLLEAGSKQTLGGHDGMVQRMGAGARELARGNTGVSDVNAGMEAFWNPALLAYNSGMRAAISGDLRALNRKGAAMGLASRIGSRMGAGVALLVRGDSDFEVVNYEDQTLGSASPFFAHAVVGVSMRTSVRNSFGIGLHVEYQDLGVASLLQEDGLQFEDQFTSPVFLDLGWLRVVNDRFTVGVVLRNIGAESDLVATYSRTLSHDNSTPQAFGYLPRVLETGVTYSSVLFSRPAQMSLQVSDYMVSEEFFDVDGDYHIVKARMGMDWMVIPKGSVRLGFDHGAFTMGLGYQFTFAVFNRQMPLFFDYALQWERNSYLFQPVSFSLRTIW
jgi:hypothetical protein